MTAYERLPVEAFGRQLITTQDLDPVYTMLQTSGMDAHQLKRWLLAYFCCYHAGLASYLSELEATQFWNGLAEAAKNETPSPIGGRWPRSAERRHWRGAAAIMCVDALYNLYEKPEQFIDFVEAGAPKYEDVAKRVKTHHLFGDWIAFKVADMLERVVGTHVDFSQAAIFMFNDPRKSALMVFREKQGLPSGAKIKDEDWAIGCVVDHLIAEYQDLKAPPLHDRKVGLQEVETVLCKWKSHMNGHYPIGKDTREIIEGLADWAKVSRTAATLRSSLQKEVS